MILWITNFEKSCSTAIYHQHCAISHLESVLMYAILSFVVYLCDHLTLKLILLICILFCEHKTQYLLTKHYMFTIYSKRFMMNFCWSFIDTLKSYSISHHCLMVIVIFDMSHICVLIIKAVLSVTTSIAPPLLSFVNQFLQCFNCSPFYTSLYLIFFNISHTCIIYTVWSFNLVPWVVRL